ncbi:hypothetical protein J7E91_32620 [Streptomyces sp. ISL-99]|uniref:hypothetical protein n=1 Tax=Streptomyces sp. ISL-99 TaxID=2819193 RepID=UPI001BEB51F7|nr:hypothetical protein [Streptomyces sp. ISL-99]MBT2529977.1 hypothetical protein [Streptomyces sp. ISL-99]
MSEQTPSQAEGTPDEEEPTTASRRGRDHGVPIITTPHASRRLQGLHGFSRAVGLRT